MHKTVQENIKEKTHQREPDRLIVCLWKVCAQHAIITYSCQNVSIITRGENLWKKKLWQCLNLLTLI